MFSTGFIKLVVLFLECVIRPKEFFTAQSASFPVFNQDTLIFILAISIREFIMSDTVHGHIRDFNHGYTKFSGRIIMHPVFVIIWCLNGKSSCINNSILVYT